MISTPNSPPNGGEKNSIDSETNDDSEPEGVFREAMWRLAAIVSVVVGVSYMLINGILIEAIIVSITFRLLDILKSKLEN